MNTLKGLTSAARAALGEDFRRGDVLTVDVSSYTTDIDFGRQMTLEPLREVIDVAMKKFGNDPVKSDPWLGPRVHAAFRLTRREAADKRPWQYLAVVEFPDYVRWRWGNGDEKLVSLERFFGWESENALAKLWWAAELVRNGADYTFVTEALRISRFYTWQRINCMHHKVCGVAVAQFLTNWQGGRVSEAQALQMARALNLRLRTVCLDMLAPNPQTDAEAIREWVHGKVDATLLLGDELPAGPDEVPIPDDDIAAVRQFLDDLAERIDLSGTKLAKKSQAVAADG